MALWYVGVWYSDPSEPDDSDDLDGPPAEFRVLEAQDSGAAIEQSLRYFGYEDDSPHVIVGIAALPPLQKGRFTIRREVEFTPV